MPEETKPAAPTAQHHFNLALLLQILAAVAPAVAAPFVKNPHSQEVLAEESAAVNSILGAVAQSQS